MTRNHYQGRTAHNRLQIARLIGELPHNSAFRRRLELCGTLSQGTHGYVLRCKLPPCPTCRSMYATRQKKIAQSMLMGAANEGCALITVVLGATDHLGSPAGGALDGIVAKGRRDMRNVVDRQRRTDKRWAAFQLTGWLEMDALDGGDVCLLGSDRRALVSDLASPIGLAAALPLWIPTLHAVARFDGLPWQEVQAALAKQWRFARQVHVRPFNTILPIEQNAANCVHYSLKHHCTTSLQAIKEPWPARWMADYYLWLNEWSGSFKRTRLTIRSSRQSMAVLDQGNVYLDKMPMPYAYDFSVYPALY